VEEGVKRLIAGQIEKAEEKLRAAQGLLQLGFWDDAISRAYYAVFHAASAVLLSRGITAKSHEAVKTLFGLHFIKTGEFEKEYAHIIHGLKDDRENGDYDVFTNFGREDAEKAIQEAERFLKRIGRFLKEQGDL